MTIGETGIQNLLEILNSFQRGMLLRILIILDWEQTDNVKEPDCFQTGDQKIMWRGYSHLIGGNRERYFIYRENVHDCYKKHF